MLMDHQEWSGPLLPRCFQPLGRCVGPRALLLQSGQDLVAEVEVEAGQVRT